MKATIRLLITVLLMSVVAEAKTVSWGGPRRSVHKTKEINNSEQKQDSESKEPDESKKTENDAIARSIVRASQVIEEKDKEAFLASRFGKEPKSFMGEWPQPAYFLCGQYTIEEHGDQIIITIWFEKKKNERLECYLKNKGSFGVKGILVFREACLKIDQHFKDLAEEYGKGKGFVSQDFLLGKETKVDEYTECKNYPVGIECRACITKKQLGDFLMEDIDEIIIDKIRARLRSIKIMNEEDRKIQKKTEKKKRKNEEKQEKKKERKAEKKRNK